MVKLKFDSGELELIFLFEFTDQTSLRLKIMIMLYKAGHRCPFIEKLSFNRFQLRRQLTHFCPQILLQTSALLNQLVTTSDLLQGTPQLFSRLDLQLCSHSQLSLEGTDFFLQLEVLCHELMKSFPKRRVSLLLCLVLGQSAF